MQSLTDGFVFCLAIFRTAIKLNYGHVPEANRLLHIMQDGHRHQLGRMLQDLVSTNAISVNTRTC